MTQQSPVRLLLYNSKMANMEYVLENQNGGFSIYRSNCNCSFYCIVVRRFLPPRLPLSWPSFAQWRCEWVTGRMQWWLWGSLCNLLLLVCNRRAARTRTESLQARSRSLPVLIEEIKKEARYPSSSPWFARLLHLSHPQHLQLLANNRYSYPMEGLSNALR